MSSRNVTCDLDSFAAGIEQLVGDIPAACNGAAEKAVRKSIRKGAKTVKGHAAKGGVHAWSGEYVGGFSSKMLKSVPAEGEIGNEAKPGLVHLLEKGHATLTGRRTRAFPHMAPAFEEMQGDFVETFMSEVGAAL